MDLKFVKYGNIYHRLQSLSTGPYFFYKQHQFGNITDDDDFQKHFDEKHTFWDRLALVFLTIIVRFYYIRH